MTGDHGPPAKHDLVAVLEKPPHLAPGSSIGSVPRQVSSSRHPRDDRSGPDTVPDWRSGPHSEGYTRLLVWCATICANVQYIVPELADSTGGPEPGPAARMSLGREPHFERAARASPARGRRHRPDRASGCGSPSGRRRSRHPVRTERLQRHDPRRHRRREALPQERAQRLVLPPLHVAGGPVVQQAHAEQVRLARRRDGHAACPAGLPGADEGREFEFVVEAAARAEHRRRCRSSGGSGRAAAGWACR